MLNQKRLLEKLASQNVKNHKVQISTLLLPTALNLQLEPHSVHLEARCAVERVVSLQQMLQQIQERARIVFQVESACRTNQKH